MTTPGHVRIGSKFLLQVLVAGRQIPFEYEVKRYVPSTDVAFVAETKMWRSYDQIHVECTPTGKAVVTYTAELTPKGLARVMTPFLRRAFQRVGDRAVAGLREALAA